VVAGQWRDVQGTAQGLGVELTSLELTAPEDLERAFEISLREDVEALLVLPDPLTNTYREQIASFALANRLPSMFAIKEGVEVGGLMTYGPDRTLFYRRAADYVHRILQGNSPAEMPIERPTRLDLVLNLKTAQAIGLTFPRTILVTASEVIQ
jgi:putative tryptophan/tyrosine transport system substrate-binding protein